MVQVLLPQQLQGTQPLHCAEAVPQGELILGVLGKVPRQRTRRPGPPTWGPGTRPVPAPRSPNSASEAAPRPTPKGSPAVLPPPAPPRPPGSEDGAAPVPAGGRGGPDAPWGSARQACQARASPALPRLIRPGRSQAVHSRAPQVRMEFFRFARMLSPPSIPKRLDAAIHQIARGDHKQGRQHQRFRHRHHLARPGPPTEAGHPTAGPGVAPPGRPAAGWGHSFSGHTTPRSPFPRFPWPSRPPHSARLWPRSSPVRRTAPKPRTASTNRWPKGGNRFSQPPQAQALRRQQQAKEQAPEEKIPPCPVPQAHQEPHQQQAAGPFSPAARTSGRYR